MGVSFIIFRNLDWKEAKESKKAQAGNNGYVTLDLLGWTSHILPN